MKTRQIETDMKKNSIESNKIPKKLKQYSFKISKKNIDAESKISSKASVIIGKNRSYSIYPYENAGNRKNNVKFAQDVATFKWYVVKKFKHKPLNEIEMLKKNHMFVDYLQIEPKTNKTNCCSSLQYGLYQLGFISGRHYVVQELIDGETLFELSHTLTYSNIFKRIKTVVDILRCVEEFHEKNIIHRDIKGNNLMYDNEKQKWRLMDFGAAIDSCKLPFSGKMNDCPGSNGFDSPETSPEFYKKNGYTLPSFKSDIYSLGIVFKNYIFCDDNELQNSNVGNAISAILNSMTNNSAMLRPNISNLIFNFQSLLKPEILSDYEKKFPPIKSFQDNSSIKMDLSFFDKIRVNNPKKVQVAEFLDAHFANVNLDGLGISSLKKK